MTDLSAYLDYSNAPDQLTGGVRRIPISTPKGEFSVWIKRVGNNPKIRLLLLHGGPGAACWRSSTRWPISSTSRA